MAQPKIKSSKQHIRLWFEFYKLCLRDKSFRANLKKSKTFYAPWGDVESIKFDDWWKEHKNLFGTTQVEEISKVTNHPNSLNVTIPLNQPVSKSIKQLKEMIEERQVGRLKEIGIDPRRLKTKSVSFGSYETTPGIEIRGKTLYESQLMYSIWLEMGKPAVNTQYCLLVVKWFKSRKRSNWIPYLLQQDPMKDKQGKWKYSEDQLRQVRRYLKRAGKVCESVSKGEFPGRVTL